MGVAIGEVGDRGLQCAFEGDVGVLVEGVVFGCEHCLADGFRNFVEVDDRAVLRVDAGYD